MRLSVNEVNEEFGPNSAFVDDGKIYPVYYYQYRLIGSDHICKES